MTCLETIQQWLPAVSTFLMVIVLIIHGFILRKQARISEDQKRLLERQVEIADMMRIDPFRPAISCHIPAFNIQVGLVSEITLGRVFNHGKGTALEVEADIICGKRRRIGHRQLAQDLVPGEPVSSWKFYPEAEVVQTLGSEYETNPVLVLFRSRDIRGMPYYDWHVWMPINTPEGRKKWCRCRGGYARDKSGEEVETMLQKSLEAAPKEAEEFRVKRFG